MISHMLPNVIATYIVLMTITLGFAIVVEASLSFLGVGVPEGVPTWGSMLEIGRAHIDEQGWLVVFPGIVIALVVFAVNFLGDGLRDVLDPRLRGANPTSADRYAGARFNRAPCLSLAVPNAIALHYSLSLEGEG